MRRSGQCVINLGMSGNGPLLNLASIVEYASLAQPRTVYWLHFEHNDLGDFQYEQRFPLLLNYLDPGWSQSLQTRQDEIDAYLGVFSK